MTAPSVRTVVWLRTLLSVAVGVGASAIVIPELGLVAGILSGWGVFALANVVWVLLLIWPMDAAATKSMPPSRPLGAGSPG